MADDAKAFSVKYLGFVHIDKPSGGVPEASAVHRAADLLKTKKKEARALHPLFARGLDTPLALKVLPSGLTVTLTTDGQEAIVMNHPMHKIAFVCDIGTCAIFIVKREGKGRFKCHSFEAGNAATARAIAAETAQRCNELFRKVRKSVRRMTHRRESRVGTIASLPEEDLRAATAMVTNEKAKAAQLLQTKEEDGQEEESQPSDSIEYIDGITDDLAHFVLGSRSSEMALTADLDDEVFGYGEITGEAEC